jgi:hypothetical protein
MKHPLLLFAIGGGVVAGILLLTRRSSAAPSSPETTGFDPNVFYGEKQKIALAVPSGWRRVTNAEVTAVPDLLTQATTLRSTPGFTSMAYGTLTPFTASDGKTYATWVEQHYHEPGGPVKPWGLHHGVTLLAKAEPN